MKTENKFLIGIGLITVIAVLVGVFVLGRGNSSQIESREQVDVLAGAKFAEGSPEAKVKIVEFGDYQCPACGQAHPIIKDLISKNSGKVYFVFRQFPLPSHPNAKDGARAAIAAGEQGKYFEMHDLLFSNQKEWTGLSNPKDKLVEYANRLELDISKFEKDFNDAIGLINSDAALGEKAGVGSTPTFFINGEQRVGVIPATELQGIIDANYQ